MNALVASTIVDVDGLEELSEAWWTLWAQTPAATPFQSPAWVLAWWRAFHPGTLAVVAVHDGCRLVALAPLYLEHGDLGVRLLPIGIGVSDYCDVLIAPETSGADTMIVACCESLTSWRVWELSNSRADAAARHLQPPARTRAIVRDGDVCPVLTIPADARGLDDIVPAFQRRKLRMARHRLNRRGLWRVLGTDAMPPADWLAALGRLHAARWRSRGETGVLADARMQTLLALALPELMARGLLRCWAIEIGGRLAGVYLGFHHAGTAYAWLGGFDPEFAAFSPGAVLMGHAIEAAVLEGAETFDFLRGREPYKYRWGAQDRGTHTLAFVRTDHAD